MGRRVQCVWRTLRWKMSWECCHANMPFTGGVWWSGWRCAVCVQCVTNLCLDPPSSTRASGLCWMSWCRAQTSISIKKTKKLTNASDLTVISPESETDERQGHVLFMTNQLRKHLGWGFVSFQTVIKHWMLTELSVCMLTQKANSPQVPSGIHTGFFG